MDRRNGRVGRRRGPRGVRGLMVAMVPAALLCCGLRGGVRPGWHVGALGVELGACRDGRDRLHGREGPSAAYLLGAWDRRTGEPLWGLLYQGGRLTARPPGTRDWWAL